MSNPSRARSSQIIARLLPPHCCATPWQLLAVGTFTSLSHVNRSYQLRFDRSTSGRTCWDIRSSFDSCVEPSVMLSGRSQWISGFDFNVIDGKWLLGQSEGRKDPQRTVSDRPAARAAFPFAFRVALWRLRLDTSRRLTARTAAVKVWWENCEIPEFTRSWRLQPGTEDCWNWWHDMASGQEGKESPRYLLFHFLPLIFLSWAEIVNCC